MLTTELALSCAASHSPECLCLNGIFRIPQIPHVQIAVTVLESEQNVNGEHQGDLELGERYEPNCMLRLRSGLIDSNQNTKLHDGGTEIAQLSLVARLCNPTH